MEEGVLQIYNNNYQPNFRAAKLLMPGKAYFEERAGKLCAEQLEKARPTIEEIAKSCNSTKKICVYPQSYESININATDNNMGKFEWSGVNLKDTRNGESFAECVIRHVKDAIERAKDMDGCLL